MENHYFTSLTSFFKSSLKLLISVTVLFLLLSPFVQTASAATLNNCGASTLNYYAGVPPVYTNTVNDGDYFGQATRASILAALGENTDEAIALIQSAAQNYSSWGSPANTYDGRYWLAGMPGISLELAAWQLWPYLDQNTQNLVKNVLITQGEKFLDVEPRSTWNQDDSTAVESNASIASYLILLSQMFPDASQAFETQGLDFALNTYTTPGETTPGVTTQTIDGNYLVYEHGIYPNVTYALAGSMYYLGLAASAYIQNGESIPWQLEHNVTEVFEANQKYINNDYSLNFTSGDTAQWLKDHGIYGKDEWNTDATYDVAAYAYYSYLTGNDVLTPLLNYKLASGTPLVFNPDPNVNVYWPGCEINYSGSGPVLSGCQDALNFYYTQGGKYYINSYNARANLINCMLFNKLIPTPCVLTSVSWSTATATQGDSVGINATTSGDCNGKTLTFQVWQYGIGGGQMSDPSPSTITLTAANQTSTNWTAQFTPVIPSTQPQYYIKASLLGGNTIDTSQSPQSLLTVSQSGGSPTSPPSPPPPVVEGCNVNGVATIGCIEVYVKNFVQFAFPLVGAVALLFLIFGGLRFILSSGEPKSVEGAKKTLTYVILGLVIIFSIYLIFTLIGQATGLDLIRMFKVVYP